MVPAVTCDVLVVGAGPAGSCAAASAASGGVSTILIDAKIRIGEQPHCGEFVPSRLFAEFHLDKACIIQSVEFMETRVLQGLGGVDVVLKNEVPSPGFMIDRVRFDRDLARKASAEGAEVFCGTRLVALDRGRWIAQSSGGDKAFLPKLVIAADGALSAVAALLGIAPFKVIKGIQVEAPLSEPLDRTIVFLDPAFAGGYGWVFPKGNVANVGLGASRDQNTVEILERFLEGLRHAGVIRSGILARSGGVIPVSGMRQTLAEKSVAFCGDAAGLTHPITGSGIPQAVLSGSLAGRAAATAIRTGDLGLLKEYENEIRGRYGGVLNHALSKRIAMTEQKDYPDFVKSCENTWIAFKGYKKRIRDTRPQETGRG
ncbi:MAG: NAD(P)/FAD-dependent oxidoreductase [Desulfomonile tiedjei]|uniref:NAD(P)/FAD-dependent oxidoreductase n=1 Tax=Desulfomonile tiedjei TaxID=2358 RepID=A0A9D6Z5E3_9BACT|nr:NAD(P)/FAD-dependent oxidoreductase [Desulfomonile tiedjei]